MGLRGLGEIRLVGDQHPKGLPKLTQLLPVLCGHLGPQVGVTPNPLQAHSSGESWIGRQARGHRVHRIRAQVHCEGSDKLGRLTGPGPTAGRTWGVSVRVQRRKVCAQLFSTTHLPQPVLVSLLIEALSMGWP